MIVTPLLETPADLAKQVLGDPKKVSVVTSVGDSSNAGSSDPALLQSGIQCN